MPQKHSLIPEGYTFLNPETMISKHAHKLFKEWAAQMEKCNPDFFDMYIYNDFASYGQLHVVDHALRGIHSRIERRMLEETFYRLEALIFVNSYCGGWTNADDGDRVRVTDKLFGACLVKTLQKLKEDNKLNVETFPNLETVLKEAAEWGQTWEDCLYSKYQVVCRGIGKRLFENKSPETVAQEKAMAQEWIDGLDKEEQEKIERKLKEDDEDEDEDDEDDEGGDDEDNETGKRDKKETPWFDQGEANENLKHRNFIFSRVWKDYTAYLEEVPLVPLKGPPTWDLTKWTEKEKAPFLFSNMDDEF